MKLGIGMKLDVTKLDKSRFFKGEKGTYADLTLYLNDEEDKYGNHGFVTQSKKKDEDVRLPIVGNVKIFWRDEDTKPKTDDLPDFEEDLEIPF